MIKYMTECTTGHKIEWETMIRGGVSAPVVTAIAKSMAESINADLAEIYKPDEQYETETAVEKPPKCDITSIKMTTEGRYVVIRYAIRVNTMSVKMRHRLLDIGAIVIKD